MKKLIFCISFLLVATLSYTQTSQMTFMNIPLGGNVHNFVLMLSKKNFIIKDSLSEHIIMSGKFIDVDARIFVKYNPKDKKVYCVQVDFDESNLYYVLFYEFEELYNVKYGKCTKEIHYSLDDWTRNYKAIWQFQFGDIKMTYWSYLKSLSIQYIDNISYKNYIKQKKKYNDI